MDELKILEEMREGIKQGERECIVCGDCLEEDDELMCKGCLNLGF